MKMMSLNLNLANDKAYFANADMLSFAYDLDLSSDKYHERTPIYRNT